MLLHQFYLGCLSHASYVVADEATGEALIVDPQRDIDTYSEFLAERGLHPIGTALTHFHADFLAGHIELRERYGIPIYLGSKAQAEFSFVPLEDGQIITVGEVEVEALHTPGHTPEGISLVVRERSGAEPHAVLTGDTLFIGDVGRPDLLASIGVTSDELANMLYDSLHGKLLQLPDAVLVYPAHGAGSLCGKHLSEETVSTIGAQRKENYALQELDRAKFVELVTAEQPAAPSYFLHDAVLNKQERQSLDQAMAQELVLLGPDRVREHLAAGDQVIDTRDADVFHLGFMRGTVNIGLKGRYAPWAGSILDTERPIVVITDPEDTAEAVMRLGRIGYDNVVGAIEWPSLAAALREEELDVTDRLLPDQLAEYLAAVQPIVVDVRAPSEHKLGGIPGARNVPLQDLAATAAAWDRDAPYLVHCAGGYRSSCAVSILHSLGFTAVRDLHGGFKPGLLPQEARAEP